ncbi:hypothetical protein [Streptomyces abikoensis]|uniref:hypothetical protein n=1 Tax=Streptomyces abikoensis TaxID=97398 RepID=UPI001676A9D6|nr:hypothetical protein [Streptomyces abikoensis]
MALFVFVDGLVDAIPGIPVMTSGTRTAARTEATATPRPAPSPVLGAGDGCPNGGPSRVQRGSMGRPSEA